MLNNDLLFSHNNKKSKEKFFLSKDKRIVYNFDTDEINGIAIGRFLMFLKGLHLRWTNMKAPIIINLGKAKFADKLTICIFESICYNLIETYGHYVRLRYSITSDIGTEGFKSSPLLLLGTKNREDIKKFKKKFEFDMYGNHYRKILSGEENAESDFLCKLMTDIDSFLKFRHVEEACRDEVAEVIVELVGNAIEHTKSDCLLDIDITKEYKMRATGEPCYGINIVVLGYSKQLLSDALKEKILSSEKLGDRYIYVRNAYKYHKSFFDEKYTEEDFFNIASFQHKISGSRIKRVSGGTGLTKLICSLEKRSEDHNCYVVSGTRVINFIREFLEYDDDNWIGFNEDGNFQSGIPNSRIISYCPVYIPGTAYNLNFVMRKEKDDGK